MTPATARTQTTWSESATVIIGKIHIKGTAKLEIAIKEKIKKIPLPILALAVNEIK